MAEIIELSSEILCQDCKESNDQKERFDCKRAQSVCTCWFRTPSDDLCKCCRVCKRVKTTTIDISVQNGDSCVKCTKNVIHTYSKFGENELANSYSSSSSSSDVLSLGAADSTSSSSLEYAGNYGTRTSIRNSSSNSNDSSGSSFDSNQEILAGFHYSAICISNTSIHDLHDQVVRRYQQDLRWRVPEVISAKRELKAVELGRVLTPEEVSNLWVEYINSES
jgi:hypothetical protein